MQESLEKVTCFVTRDNRGDLQLLLFGHPFPGVQLPAGTVEAGEAPLDSALRGAGGFTWST